MKKWLILAGTAALLSLGLGLALIPRSPNVQGIATIGRTPYRKSSSTRALTAVVDGQTTIAVSAIATNSRTLVDHPLGVFGIAVIAHDRHIDLTRTQLAQVFSRQFTNWRQLGYPTSAIRVLDYPASADLHTNFEALMPGSQLIHASTTVNTVAAMQQAVAKTPGAIGYIPLNAVRANTVLVALAGVTPTAENIATNAWPLWTYTHLYTKGAPDYRTAKLIHAWQHDARGVRQVGLLPLASMQVARTRDGGSEDSNAHTNDH